MRKNSYRNTTIYSRDNRHRTQDFFDLNKTVEIPDKNKDYYPDSSVPEDVDTCSRSAFQRANVCVPVAVKPFSFAGPTKTTCCGEPNIDEVLCKKNHNDEICYFTITQEICVEIPVHFGATARVGEAWVECLDASTDDCDDCD